MSNNLHPINSLSNQFDSLLIFKPTHSFTKITEKTSKVFEIIYNSCDFPKPLCEIIYDYYFTSNRCQTLMNTKDFILYQLPSGKPDPNDQDVRISLPPASYPNTSCYHALDVVRFSAGNHSSSKEEEICAVWRKELAQYEATIPLPFQQLETELWINELFISWHHTQAKQLLQQWENTNTLIVIDKEKQQHDFSSVIPFLKKFIAQTQCNNFRAYVLCKTAEPRRKINQDFFIKTNNSPVTMFQIARLRTWKVRYESIKEKWEDLCHHQQESFEERYTLSIAAQSYGLKKSTWHPAESITVLITALKNHGPLAVSGRFDKHYNENSECTLEEKIAGRNIFIWNSEHIHKSPEGGITIVGACSIDTTVYYVDPRDGSDPACIVTQKIYRISYTLFRHNIRSVDGFPTLFHRPNDHRAPGAYGWYSPHFSIKQETQAIYTKTEKG